MGARVGARVEASVEAKGNACGEVGGADVADVDGDGQVSWGDDGQVF